MTLSKGDIVQYKFINQHVERRVNDGDVCVVLHVLNPEWCRIKTITGAWRDRKERTYILARRQWLVKL